MGLDPDPMRIPKHLAGAPNPIFSFNKAIIDATHSLCVSYKPNIAFYEAMGTEGWEVLGQTIAYIKEKDSSIFVIADAKRGDIGNTAQRYARAFFEDLGCDAVTVSPYMGKDSVEPFLEFEDKMTILLALTSNVGATDFQLQTIGDEYLFEKVIRCSQSWTNPQNLMYVVGATQASYLKKIRQLVPEAFLLIPGVGAQGGSLPEVCQYGANAQGGLLINSSRGILYASQGEDFAQAAHAEALKIWEQMQAFLPKVPKENPPKG